MLVLLQFDAACLPIVERMLEEGRLPALASLRARGRWSTLDADSDLFEAATHATCYTGIPLSEHGLYYHFVWSAAEQRARYMEAMPKPETIWERLGRAGHRSLIIDPYHMWLGPQTPGVCITGWQFRHYIIPHSATPKATYRRLTKEFGSPPTLNDVAGRRTTSGLLELRRNLLAGPDRAAAAAVDLMKREEFDLVWVTFIGSHQAGHHLFDLSVLESDPENDARRALESALEDVYTEIDRAMERIVAALPKDADLIVLSPLGMGPNTTRSDMLPDMLAAVLGGPPMRSSRNPGAGSSIWRTRATFPSGARAGVARLLPGDVVRDTVARLYFRGVNWERTPAFVLPGDHFGNVRLNLRGRESDGIVAPDAAAALLDEITDGLASFTDPDGAPAIAGIERIAQKIVGPRSEHLPDLVVKWSERPSSRLRKVISPRFGEVLRRGVGTGRSGNHMPGSWCLLVPGGSTIRTLSRPPQLIDIAATACALLNVDASTLTGESLFAMTTN